MAQYELHHTSLTWETPLSDTTWARANELAGSGAERTPGAQEIAAVIELGPGLPTADEGRIAFLSLVQLRDRTTLRWNLQLTRAPEGAPPDEVIEADTALGGQEALKALVVDSLPSAQVSMSLRATALLSTQRWRCLLLGEALSEFEGPVRKLGIGPLREQVGYRFQDGPHGLNEVAIVYDHVRARFHVTVLAGIPWRPEATAWLRNGEDGQLIDLMVRSLFAEEEAE